MSSRWPLAFALITVVLFACPWALAQDDTTTGSREDAIARQLFHLVNDLRQERGLPPFLMNEALNRAAALHSQDMVMHNFFDHISPVPGRTAPHDRAGGSGYASTTIAENLFMTMGTPDDAIAQLSLQTWVQSPNHLRNLLDRSRTDMGVGVFSSSQQETYVTAVFGGP